MLNRVKQYIAECQLLDHGTLNLVALSGGADSVCLLHVLRSLGYRVEAAHCNFHLRAEESLRDEEFCRRLCEQLGVALHVAQFDTATYAQAHSLSIEMAARELRYEWFERLRQERQAAAVCVAHHALDQAETVVMNLLRSTGIRGLGGIRPKRDHIVRPLLGCKKEQIAAYLAENGLQWVDDSTNADTQFLRNRIRHEVIPALKQAHPQAVEAICQTANHVNDALPLLEWALQQQAEKVQTPEGISIERLLQSPAPQTLLLHLLAPYGFSAAQSADIFAHLNAHQGALWHSATHSLLLHQGHLVAQPTHPEPSPLGELKGAVYLLIPSEGTYPLPDGRTLTIEKIAREELTTPSREANIITIDAQLVAFPLTLRPYHTGERFRPFGMRGSKLISDYLADRHINRFDRSKQLVLTDANGKIIWLVGRTISADVALTNHTTAILRIAME